MGKITQALTRYAKERREARPNAAPAAELSPAEASALVNYDRKTGYLVGFDRQSGRFDPERLGVLQRNGTVQRLIEKKLIFPSGKLTPRGLEEARRLGATAPSYAVSPLESRLDTPVAHPTAAEAEAPPVTPGFSPEASDRGKDPGNGGGPLPQAVAARPAALVSPPAGSASAEREYGLRARAASALPETVKDDRAAQTRSSGSRPQATPAYDEKAIDPGLVTLIAPNSFEAEQFKILRTHLLYPVNGQPPRSILVTSAAPGEGKTFVAANLAISMALNINRHVLLIDADLRIPQLHRRFGFGDVPGLSNYLAEGRMLPSLLLKTKVEKLTLLPGGPPPENPAELLSCDRMTHLLEEVSRRYADRLIIIDAPPPAMTAETGALARQVEGVLLVVNYGRTRRADLADLVSRLGEEKILGVIANRSQKKFSRYYGYNYDRYRSKSH